MMIILYVYLSVWAVLDSANAVSTKIGFSDDDDDASEISTNSTNTDDEDVEVKHTIVVSTRLKNGNRRGLHSTDSREGNKGMFNIERKREKEDDAEVPVVRGYKSVETTHIRTPDTRLKAQARPESVFINRNIRDDYDIYPNFVSNPSLWKPSSVYNNINWLNQDINSRVYQNPNKFHRRITDDGMKEFYCKKCRELNDGQIFMCAPQRRNSPRYIYETTTPKVKIDGKLAKLN